MCFGRYNFVCYDIEISEVWDLLLNLPTNSSLLKKFIDLQDEPSWHEMLDQSNTFKLLYALFILNSLMHPGSDDAVLLPSLRPQINVLSD